MWWFFEIFSCFKFIYITGDENVFKSKRVYEFIIPISITIIFFVAYEKYPEIFIPNIVEGLSKNIFQFMVFVVPFHLAALGAFSTFNATGLDGKLSGVNAQLRVWSNADNDYFYKPLTLRQYVSLLFGYLCSIGIIYIMVYIIFSVFNFEKINSNYYSTCYDVLFYLTIFFIVHYVVLTIYAITFLFDKINKIKSV